MSDRIASGEKIIERETRSTGYDAEAVARGRDEYLQKQRDLDRRVAEHAARGREQNIDNARRMLAYADDAMRAAVRERSERKVMLAALLSEDIRATRELLGVYQEKAADMVGISRVRLAQAETKTGTFSINELDRIRLALREAASSGKIGAP